MRGGADVRKKYANDKSKLDTAVIIAIIEFVGIIIAAIINKL